MKILKYFTSVILIFGLNIGAKAQGPKEICSELTKLSRPVINRLYIEASADLPPEGEFISCELARPDGPLNAALRWIADYSWNGMKYSAQGNNVEVYLTKIDRRLKATGHYGLGKSFFDDNASFVNEYKTVTLLPDSSAWMLRDEFREIGPGVYLGMTYARFKNLRGKVSTEYVGTIAIISKDRYAEF